MKNVTPLRAIRLKCLDCSAGQPSEVRECPVTDCPLYPFRFGRNPNRKGIGGRREVSDPRESAGAPKSARESGKTSGDGQQRGRA